MQSLLVLFQGVIFEPVSRDWDYASGICEIDSGGWISDLNSMKNTKFSQLSQRFA